MFSATRRWLRRNRTPIAVGAGVVGAGYVVTKYVLGKINDARERMSSDRISKENLRRRFEQNQEDCTFTVLALLPTATKNILDAMDTEKITYQIQQKKARPTTASSSTGPPSIADTNLTEDDGRSLPPVAPPTPVSPDAETTTDAATTTPEPAAQEPTAAAASATVKTKRQLWDDLAISSITRAFTLIYTLALLTMLTRVQLNLLGRRSYLSSVITLATGSAQASIGLENNDDDGPHQTYGSDFDINRRYLTFSWWLLNRGWEDLRTRVEAAVRNAFGHLSPRDELSLDMFGRLASQVRNEVESNLRWLSLLLPPQDQEEHMLREAAILGNSAAETSPELDGSVVVVPSAATTQRSSSSAAVPPPLRRLLDETSDLVDSPAFSHVLTLLLDAGFSTLVEGELAKTVFGAAAVPRPTVQLPKVLSCLTRQAHDIGHGMPNRYLQAMEAVRDLGAFSAVVYSSNWQNEMRDDADEPLAGSEAVLVPQPQPSKPTATAKDPFESAWDRAVEKTG